MTTDAATQTWTQRLANPTRFMALSGQILPWLTIAAIAGHEHIAPGLAQSLHHGLTSELSPLVVVGADVPGNLKKAAHVTMEGRYDAKRGAFVATLLQTQCPSRYEGKELTPANEEEKPAP